MGKDKAEVQDKIDQIDSWYSYWKKNTEVGRDLKAFLMGDQWDDASTSYYKTHNKVPMTVNKLYAHVMQLVGEQRQISPNLKVTPLAYNPDDAQVSKDISLYESLIQEIGYAQKTDIVWQTTYKNQLVVGYGAVFVYSDYTSENSFHQEIRLMSFEEPQNCYFDPSSRESDKSDGEYCGAITDMSEDEFKNKYPDADYDSAKDAAIADTGYSRAWYGEDRIAIADHYYKVWHKKKICLLSDGSTVDKDDVDSELRDKNKKLKMMQQLEILSSAQGKPINITNGMDKIEVIDERQTSYCKIKHCRMTRTEILEEEEWPSKLLPIVFVDGDSYFIDGEQYVRPYIMFTVDTQKFINFCSTETISYIKGGRKEKFLITKSNTENNKRAWKGIDNDNIGLYYDPDTRTGSAPIPIPPLEIPQTLLMQYNRAEHDLHTILGRYESSVGAQGNEVSGAAVANRIRQGNVTAMVYPDNLLRAQTQVGRIILDMIPTIYDTFRPISVTAKDGSRKVMEINKQVDKDKYENKIEKKDYEIAITGGSSFSMQKAEAYSQLMEFMARVPAAAGILPDLAAENLELSNTPKIVERIRKYLIPNIAMEEQGKQPPPPQPSPQDQLMRSMATSEAKKADASLMSAQSRMIKAQADLKKDFSSSQADKIKAEAEVGKASLQYQQEVVKTNNAKLERENQALRRIAGVE